MMNSDVLIVGGGVIGLIIARELHKKGVRDITLVEKTVCANEASRAAAGILGPQAETDKAGAFFDLSCASRDLFPGLAAELLDETGIDIELDRTGTLYIALTDTDSEQLQKRFEWQHRAGLEVERLSTDEVLRLEPRISPKLRDALLFPNDWQVENRKLLAALRRYLETNGIRIVENCAAKSLLLEQDRVIGAETTNGVITAGQTILATGAWTSLIKLGLADMPLVVKPVRGQIIAFHPDERFFRHVIYSRSGYIVPRSSDRILAGSTTEHVLFDRSVTDEAAADLHKMSAEIAPSLANLKIADQWSGLRPNSSDGLPIIGRLRGVSDLFVATAHYRNGILLAPITAKISAECVLDTPGSDELRPFAPDRFSLAANG